jgi:16S rRNA (cytosine967-C5)-methyltransferase
LKQLNKLQAELLDAGLSSLTEGGVLLYSTCSPVISETNSQVVDALQAHPEVELVDLKPVVQTISPNIVLNQKRKTIQLWSHIHETDSMFMAAFRRVG